MMQTPSEGRHSLWLLAPPPRVATGLRRHLERGGFRLLRPSAGSEPPPDALVCVLAAGPDRSTWLHLDPPEAVPEGLTRVLSEALRCEVTSIAHLGDVCVYETARGGEIVSLLATDGGRVLDVVDSPHQAAVARGKALEDCLSEAGFGAAFSSLEAIRAGRVSTLAFRIIARSDAEVIEIDPGLSCPECGEAMQKRTGRWGEFFGCVRFPDCRGKLSATDAERQRG